MLSAFTAEPIVALKPRDKSRIECILAHRDQLIVGLQTGCLRVYRVPSSDETSTRDDGNEPANKSELLKEYEKFSKYKIEQIAIFKEATILIALSGGLVSLHDLGTFELQQQLSKAKGASTFAATSNIVNDQKTGIPTLVSQLAVAVKRRLLLWSWHEGELVDDVHEIALASSIKTLTWATGTTIVAGLQASYVLVDVTSSNVAVIQGPGSIGGSTEHESSRLGGLGAGTMSYIGMGGMIPMPLATGLGDNEMILARDINTLFIDRAGQPVGRRQIPWKSAPHAIGYSYPYLLSLQEPSKGTLEVRNPQTLTLLQSIELSAATLLQVPNPNISLAHQGKGFLVASDRTVWRMKGLKYDAQVDFLVNSDMLDEAVSLLEMIEGTLIADKGARLREIKMLKAQRLFDEKQFRDALDLFGEVTAPPAHVIRLYPELISGDLAMSRPDPQSTAKSHRKTASIANVQLKNDDTASIRSSKTISEELSEKDLKLAVRELQAFLADVRRRLQRFFNADQSVKKLSEVQENAPLEDIRQITKHLLGVQDPDETNISERLREVATLVDTTLFRAHMYATPSLAGSLFRITNFCDPEVVMTKLEAAERYGDLIEFLYGKRLHRQALSRLQKFGREQKTEEIDEQLHGPERTVSYLQNLPPDDIDLILEFAQWPITVKPELGMQVFLADTANADDLPRQKVVDFLENIDATLELRYLEHIVDELGDDTPSLHQKLLTLYFENAKRARTEEKRDLISKFVTLLKTSTQYSAAKVLEYLPRDDPDFYEATAVVFSKMGQHRQALRTYVFNMHDTKKAEEYCNQVYMEEAVHGDIAPKATARHPLNVPLDEKPSIYHVLLNLYLNSPEESKPLVGPAIELMAKHGPRLPASSTLELIPNDLLVNELEFYFRGRVRNANTAMYDAAVKTGLSKVESVRLKTTLLLGDTDTGIRSNGGRQRKVRIDDERVCGVCFKRLGGSIISVFPDNSVVHLGCASRRQQELETYV